MGFLPDCENDGSGFRYRDVRFSLLWVDVEWLDLGALREIHRLAADGTSVCLAQRPRQPGYRHHEEYAWLLDALTRLPNVRDEVTALRDRPPLVVGESIPEFWARVVDDELVIFFAHPASLSLAYPMLLGQSLCEQATPRELCLNVHGRTIPLRLEFPPYQSLIVRVAPSGKIRTDCFAYVPPSPPRNVEAFRSDHRYPGYYLAEKVMAATD